MRITTTRIYQYTDLPVGMTPKGLGWEQFGYPQGRGGAVTHRQQWRRYTNIFSRLAFAFGRWLKQQWKGGRAA